MARPGPPPTPTATLKLAGSWRAKARKSEPKPKRGAPAMPTWLSRSAKAEWKRIVPQLVRLGVIADMDRATLAIYCESWAEYYEAKRLIEIEGRTFMSAKGYQGVNPNVTMMNQARTAVLRFAQEFGLTPSARARLGTQQVREPDARKSRFFKPAG